MARCLFYFRVDKHDTSISKEIEFVCSARQKMYYTSLEVQYHKEKAKYFHAAMHVSNFPLFLREKIESKELDQP